MSTWVAALIAAAAITVTYLMCIRPMMRGGSGCAMPGCGTSTASEEKETALELAALQDEVRILRAHEALDRGGAPRSPDRSG